MPFPIDEKLVVAIASSALFNLTESDRIFRSEKTEAYRRFQREHENEPLAPGIAFHFIRRLLALNELRPSNPPIEVILLSRNDPDTGLRLLNSIDSHGLPITRSAFLSGAAPWRYIEAYSACLFLSANEADVREAIEHGLPAGQVLPTAARDDPADPELRIAFDFDCVLVDDEAERVYQNEGLEQFHAAERAKATMTHVAGPLKQLLTKVEELQRLERERLDADPSYKKRLRTAIITARNSPADKRMITTLRAWGILVDQVFLLGGMEKRRIIDVFKPHIFFDDQVTHLESAAESAMSVHVPFGPTNELRAAAQGDEAGPGPVRPA